MTERFGGALALAGAAALSACGAGGPEAARAHGTTAERVEVVRGALHERVLLTGELEAVQSAKLTVPRTSAWQLSIRWIGDVFSVV